MKNSLINCLINNYFKSLKKKNETKHKGEYSKNNSLLLA